MSSQHKDDIDTKEALLDAAESVFAAKGYRGSSLRAITDKAKVNLAAVNYHFGSKMGLLEAVCERRLEPLNKKRKAGIEAVVKKAAKKKRRIKVRDIIYAFLEPTFKLRGSGPGARDFIMLIGRSFNDPDDTARRVFLRFMKPMAKLLHETLSKALPKLPPEILFWRMQFSMGAFSHTMHGDIVLIEKMLGLGDDCCKKIEKDSELDMLVDYITAGLEA